MYKLYRKSPENFAFTWIGIYCLVQSLANGISARIGMPKSANAVLVLISTSNLWLGIRMNLTSVELGVHILLMLLVGFLEELIFRGFLFAALRQSNLKTAMIVSSLTFGAGHILNLFNGSGMSLEAVLLQIVFAVLVGFLFVMVYLRSGSLIPCILSHQAINILSAFSNHQA